MAHLLKYDSVLGVLPTTSRRPRTASRSTATRIKVLPSRDPAELPWGDLGVDVVVESTGFFTARDKAAAHLEAGAPLVIVSAPSTGADATFVMRRQRRHVRPEASTRSSPTPSCTTNCFVPMVKVLDDAFGVEQGLMTTVHAYTGDQMLVDGPHSDLRRARAAADQHHPDVHRRGPGHVARAGVDEGQARRHVAAGPGARRLDHRLHRHPQRRRRPSPRSTTPSPRRRRRGPLKGMLEYTEDADRVERHRRRPALVHLRQRAHDEPWASWSRCSAGTTTSGATRTAWSTSCSTPARRSPVARAAMTA